MPVARRSRVVDAPPEAVWRVVGDPSHLGRWWPKVERIEAVRGANFTEVMRTKKGKPVRADFHTVESVRGKLHRWAQDLDGTPFERFLALNETTAELEPSGSGTQVTLTTRQKLRGLSRVGGGFMLKRATRQQLDEALDGLENVL
jgi:uncharacterized protein YndB with AHSA1/START domain